MLAYDRRGRQVEALEVYRNVRTTLAGEFGVEPEPELQKIHHVILVADPALASGAGAAALHGRENSP